ncbi:MULTISPECIES: hypothetical protein [Streptomyces]|uniref:hypothetical protein n=1 Tax=Streptomyces TaxID=1883 RepID=UPI0006195395|nr:MULTISPECIES: hypothetical protein [Streptomyces]GHC36855.1 hypothetical protein GCM10010308_64180 [Streptomyces vinaceusdrappus]
MKPTLRRIAATLTISAAAATGTLLTAGTAAADEATPADTTVVEPAGDTWWGSQPADGPTVAPFDTWWG